MKNNFSKRGQSLIEIVIALVIAGLITGGLYYYFSKQIPKMPEISEKSAEEVKPEEKVVIPPPEEKLPKEEVAPPKVEALPEEIKSEVTCQDKCSPAGSKRCSDNGYQICGNYDADACLEWSSTINCPLNTICQNGVCIQQKCADGTLYGQCSTNKPKYCDNGNLVNKCSICGCSSGLKCQIDESCVSIVIDCEYKNYKMAFVLVENSNNPATQEDINKINVLKQKVSETFAWATRNLASMDTTYPVVILRLENNPSVLDIAKEFYKENPDDFHFITIFTTYDSSGPQSHISVRNNIKGIGLNIFNNTAAYGSEGRLLGINWMKDIDMYSIDEFQLALGVNGILHETSHQWGAFVDFIDENGQKSNSLRNPYNLAHWDKKLETGYDLLNGGSWIDNGDGTFTAKTTDYRGGYSDLDLYLMGLISKNEVGPIKLIVSDYDTKDIQPGTTISGAVKTISIQQIINAEGERECVLQF